MASAAQAAPAMTYGFFSAANQRLMAGARTTELDSVIPNFTRNLKIAFDVSQAYWTDSTPYDELAKQYILPEKICEALHIPVLDAAGVKHVPAGLMHTYGYLFSQLQTAYGLKGKRWIESRLDERLGLPAGTFSPFAPKGEFLSNVTAVFFKLIGEKTAVAHAARLTPSTGLSGTLSEQVTWQTPEGREETRTVRTHLVRLRNLEDLVTSDTELLIYEVVDGKKHRLVTGFPVDAAFAAGIMKAGPATDTSFRPRYNLFIDPRWKVLSHQSFGFSTPANQ